MTTDIQKIDPISPVCAPPAPAKYIPPPMMKRMAEQRRAAEAEAARGGAPPADTGYRNSDSDRYNNRQFSSGGASSFSRNCSGSYTSLGSNQNAVADRWKGLIDDGEFDNRRRGPSGSGMSGTGMGGTGGRRPYSSAPQRESKTGTGWDVRDGRRYVNDPLPEVFKKDKDKSTGINFNSYDSIPVELTGRNSQAIQPVLSFKEARGIHPLLAENIIRVDYEKPTPVQKHSIPVILAGRDLMACAQTGSGKTAAFLFPIITKMLNDGPPETAQAYQEYRTKEPVYPVALVISPTRELAVQIYEESRKFSYNTGVRTVVVYGGSDSRLQFMDLQKGCDICVATPGRLQDLLDRSCVRLTSVKYFVLDEADRMLDMGFSPQIYSIVNDFQMPTSEDGRQTIMFSATFPNQIQKLASEFLNDYIFLTVGRVGSTNDFIIQSLLYAEERAKPKKLLQLLEEVQGGLTLVFVETKRKADLIEDFLLGEQLPAVSIHGDKCQSDRERALQLFRTGKRPILVATDVAARGLDIHNIAHVINCDLPTKVDDYVHRIGRTGRAGHKGRATSFVNEQNRPVLRDLLSLLQESGQDVPEWFLEMTRSCTSAYGKTFGSGGGSYFSKSGGKLAGKGSAGAFGSRDIRSPTGSSPTISTSTKVSSRPGSGWRGGIAEEAEDGW